MNLGVIITICILFLCSCAIGPRQKDINYVLKNTHYNKSFKGKVEVIDKTDYIKPHVDHVSNIETIIYKAAKRGGSEFDTENNDNTFKFTFYKCELIEYYPTEILPVNIIGHIFTLGFMPAGSKYNCRVDLDVVEKNKLMSTPLHMSNVFDAESGGIGILSLFDNMSMIPQYERIRIPVMQLLLEYQQTLDNQMVNQLSP